MEVTWGPFKREGTGTWSSSVLSRALEQKRQLFSATLPRKLPGAGSLNQGSGRQPGRFVYLQALENSVTSFWLLLPGAAPFLGLGEHFIQTFFCCCHPGQFRHHHPLSRGVPATAPVPAATVRRAPVGCCGADRLATFDWLWTGTLLQDSSVLSMFPGGCCLGDEGVMWSWRLGCYVDFSLSTGFGTFVSTGYYCYLGCCYFIF